MPRLIRKTDQGQVETIELRPGRNRLGRSHENDFPIEHPTVSASHCDISVTDGAVHVRDCGSTNGTFINGRLITESALNPGESLQLGGVELVLETTPPVVAIPQVVFGEAPPPSPLADGWPACLNHPGVRARRK